MDLRPRRIAFYPYALKALYPLNSRSDRLDRQGALLQVIFDEGIGYADCHPWEELGDESLTHQLQKLQQRQLTSLTECSLHWAYVDAIARAENRPLLSQTGPRSHWLIHHLATLSLEEVGSALEKGFSHVKLKVGLHLNQEIEGLHRLMSQSPMRLRLDFNEKLTMEEFHDWMRELQPFQIYIDFIEDPFPWDPILWQEIQELYGIQLACDRQCDEALKQRQGAAFHIHKPAIADWNKETHGQHERVIVTSYLDHPIGQVTAAYVASQVDPFNHRVHGLLTHYAYEKNAFSAQLNWNSPFFTPPSGTGWGFDELLNPLTWNPL